MHTRATVADAPEARDTRAAERYLGSLLLIGTVVLGVCAALHPMLPDAIDQQLRVMAATPYWRAIHVGMLAGSALVMAGVWTRVIGDRSGHRAALAIVMLCIIAGLASNALNVAYMAHTGTRSAARFATGDTTAPGAFAAGHAVSLAAAAAGNVLVALGALALGVIEARDPHRPRWVAALAWIAGIGGITGVLAFDPASRGAVAGVALFGGWSVATGILAWRTPGPRSSAGRARAASAAPAGPL